MSNVPQSSSNDSGPPTPLGQGTYTVQPGDCIESIAFQHGFLWKTLWNLPENSELKQNRQPNILLPGDRLTIPDIRPRSESRPTAAQHKFKKHGTPCTLKLRFLDHKMEPRKNLKYLLVIDGNSHEGYLDSDGALSVPIPPTASSGTIELDTSPDPERYALNLGHLDPLETPTGVRARLNNLGFACAPDGPWEQDLKDALRTYQQLHDLDVTGTLTDATKNALKDHYLT